MFERKVIWGCPKMSRNRIAGFNKSKVFWIPYSAQYISKNFLNFLKIIRSLLLIALTTLNQILNSFFGWTLPECIKCWWHNGTDMSLNYGNLKVLRRRVVSSRNSNVQIVETDNGQPFPFTQRELRGQRNVKLNFIFSLIVSLLEWRLGRYWLQQQLRIDDFLRNFWINLTRTVSKRMLLSQMLHQNEEATIKIIK